MFFVDLSCESNNSARVIHKCCLSKRAVIAIAERLSPEHWDLKACVGVDVNFQSTIIIAVIFAQPVHDSLYPVIVHCWGL